MMAMTDGITTLSHFSILLFRFSILLSQSFIPFLRRLLPTAATIISLLMVDILQWNAQSMNAHGCNFYESIITNASNQEKPGIICIQETWYDEYNMLRFPNYHLVEKNRHDKRGGLAIYIHESIAFRVINTPDINEYIIVDIYLQNNTFSLVNFYNPCKKIGQNLLDEIMKNCKEQVIVCGDFNSHNPLWGSNTLDVNGKTAEDFMNKYDLVLLNDGTPTRIDPRSGGQSSLDLTFMSKEMSGCTHWGVSGHNFGSDHFVIKYSMITNKGTQNMSETQQTYSVSQSRRHAQINWKWYKMEIESRFEDIKEKFLELNIQGKYDLLVETMVDSFDKHRKNIIKKHIDKSPVPWWNKECSRVAKERNKAKNKFMYKTFLYEDFEKYLNKKKEAQAVFRKAKREYWKNYCAKLNRMVSISSVWKRVKGIKEGNKSKIPNLILDNGKTIAKTAEEKALIFLQCFNCLEPNIDKLEANRRKEREELIKNKIGKVNTSNDNVLNDNFNIRELQGAIAEIKDTAPGKDDIQAKMIWNLPSKVIDIILDLFNEIWDKSLLPYQWSEAIQIPILKKGKEASNPSSYRPISLTPLLCKLMERLIKNRMNWYIEKNNIITPIQSGFREKRSTTDQIIRLETDINKAMINREYTVVLFLDLQKAYDLVWRQGIVSKIYELGFEGKILCWINAFLSKRTCQVRVQDHLSIQKNVEIGIMQGSVISPLLFNFMINELEKIQDTVEISVFADDICLWFSHRNPSFIKKKLQSAVVLIEAWC